MKTRRILMALLAVSILTLQTAAAQTDGTHKRPRGGWAAMANPERMATASRRLEGNQDALAEAPESADADAVSVLAKKTQAVSESLVGTWVFHIPDSPEAPGFDALQTYNADGTMTETSSLLAQGVEGPAHGVWERAERKDSYNITFQLFTFDEAGQYAGRIRVNLLVRAVGKNNLTAETGSIDFIEPNGTENNGIASGGPTITATRVKVSPVQ